MGLRYIAVPTSVQSHETRHHLHHALLPLLHLAKRLLAKKGAAFEEIDVSGDWAARDALCEKSGGRMTVPQIWIGETHAGGSDELHALDRAGKLDALLAG